MFIHYSLILVIVLSGCALKIAPSGGPANTAPTRVLEVFPASGSVNQEQPEIRFVFDDYVDRSIRNSITVMPKTPFVTTYDGDAISISFSQQLLPSTTYSVTLGTSWRNLRGIEPTQATTIIFSTGPVIDTGTISGRVVAENLSNLVVAAFPRADTLDSAFNSMKAIAPYQIQIGSDGTFSIKGLANGLFRVLAFNDSNMNGLPDFTEQFGIASGDVSVTQEHTDSLLIVVGPAPADTTVSLETPIHADSANPDIRLGSVRGEFTSHRITNYTYVARIHSVSNKIVRTVKLISGNTWYADSLAPGDYIIDVFEDRNGNASYDYGSHYPFVHSEPFFKTNILVTIRPRWTTEGVLVSIE
ncbi:MAG: hypothetical protein D8M52_04535 [Chlorobi bacterium]|nr:MAG: hypothetical protein F9K28_03665 [Bacteroidota bacterium]KXK34667.1 MAG: hypothetical protein UZ06_CHB003001131 [Chlorobi bacterium OLB6]MBL1160970.1 hypothetical protein [Chlorobiota bacterium]MBW7852928.1 Ig-like domain-containing protein [Candidatus Kapabacteria bacterium]MCC6330820.1 Ig-like domain-containing protein [Ignavibacteria bacterium]